MVECIGPHVFFLPAMVVVNLAVAQITQVVVRKSQTYNICCVAGPHPAQVQPCWLVQTAEVEP